MRAALIPVLCWDQVHPVLWLQVMTFARPNLVELAHSGHAIQRINAILGYHLQASQEVQPHLVCGEFSSLGLCSRKICHFRHECYICGSPHTLSVYPRRKPRKSWHKSGGGSGGAQTGKGAKSSKLRMLECFLGDYPSQYDKVYLLDGFRLGF